MPIAKPPVRPVWADSAPPADVVDPGASFVEKGFPLSDVPPPRQFLNWVLNYCTNAIRYFSRRGICDYDPAETYSLHDIVRGDDQCLYQSLMAGNIGNTPSVKNANWGPIGIFPRTPGELAAGVVPASFAYPEGNVLRYGADNGGRVPCDDAVAAAIAVACPMLGSSSMARQIDFPAGEYLVTKTINLTNTRQAGTRLKDGLLMKGHSSGSTRIVGQTGPGRPVIETTGAQWLSIEDLTVTAASTGSSTIGIFQGLSRVLPQTNNQKFTRLLIDMSDSPGANGGAGSVGIWNFAAEENTYDTVWIRANLPMMLTAHNPSPNTGYKTPVSYVELGSSHSLGMTTFSGECCLLTLNKRQPALMTEDVNSMQFANTYFANMGAGGNNQSAWHVYGSLIGLEYNGLVESFARLFDVYGLIVGARVRLTYGGVDASTTERIRLQRGGQGQLANCEFNITDNVSLARNLLSVVPKSANEELSCFLFNCVFRLNCDQQYTSLHESLLGNSQTGNITIEAVHGANLPYRFTVDSNRTQQMALPERSWSPSRDAAAELLKVTVPGGLDGSLSAVVSIEGIVQWTAADSITSHCRRVDADISFSVGPGGALAVSVDNRLPLDTDAKTDASGKLTLAARSVGGTYLQVTAVPALSGNATSAKFVGSARLRWLGSKPRAPVLMMA